MCIRNMIIFYKYIKISFENYLNKMCISDSQNVVEVNMVEISTEQEIRDRVKDRILCELDMKLEITHFILDLVVNHIIKDTSELFNFYINFIYKM